MRQWRPRVAAMVLAFLAAGSLGASQRGAGPGPGAAPAQDPASGLIVGRVVDAATGQPVSEAEVTVSIRAPAAPATPMGMAGAGPTNVRLLTGADGRFVVRDLLIGNVQVNARAPGYVSGAYGQTRPNGPAAPIQITKDNKIVSASIRLWKHAVITGMVTDERNDPAVNVQVAAMARSYRAGQPRFTITKFGRTDDRGRYRIPGLPPGDYVVLVPQTQSTVPVAAVDQMMQEFFGGQGLGSSLEVAAGLGAAGAGGGLGVRVGDQMISSQSGAAPVLSGDGRMSTYVTQYHPAAGTVSDASVLTLASGDERGGIDIRMPLVATSRISGTVVGPDGPLQNVPVRLLPAAESDGDMFSEVARSMTAANGTFQMYGVPAGQYVIKVLRPGRQPLPPAVANNPQLSAQLGAMMGGRGGPSSPSDALTLFADVPVALERDVSDLIITLSTGATVSGRVEFVGTSAMPPFTGISVSLVPLGSQMAPMRSTPAAEDGRFSTPGAVAGRYFIQTSGRAPGWFPKSAMVNGIDALDQPFELTTENIGNVVVTYTDRQSTVSGTVTDGSGAPAQGTVIVFPAAHKEWIARGMAGRLTRNVRTQSKGTFSIAGLPARDYVILAIADDQTPDLQNPTVFDALARAAMPLTLFEGETRTVSIKLSQVAR